MEGEKERQKEEKESNEAEDETRSDEEEQEEEQEDSEGAALIWQEGYGEDNLGLPIMHWEALSLRIAELEKQEEEKKEKRAKRGGGGASLERGRAAVGWSVERGRRSGNSWEEEEEEEEEACNSHMMSLTSRLQTQMNLQLCFINNSESEEEEEEKEKENSNSRRAGLQTQKNLQPAAKPEKPKSRGFRSTLRNLRDRLRTDTKPLTPVQDQVLVQRKHLDVRDLQNFSVKELKELMTSLGQRIQDLSTELVGRLQVRDQLRTEQDAMLLEVQDLTSL